MDDKYNIINNEFVVIMIKNTCDHSIRLVGDHALDGVFLHLNLTLE